MKPTSSSSAGGDPALLGLDNVPLDLPLAGIGSRTLAASLDHCLLFLLQLVWLIAAAAVLPRLGIAQAWLFGIIILGLFLLQWGYFAAFEISLVGQTPGKLTVGLRVVSRDGGRTTPAAVLIRNFLRTFDVLIGIPIMATDRRARRLGDMVAGTLVVHHRADKSQDTRLERHPADWGAREVAVVESFLRRAELMDPEVAQGLADLLLRWIAESEPGFWQEVELALTASEDRVLTLRLALKAGA